MSQICLNINSKYPRTFTGKERDSETGFSYFGARYYDSDLMTGWLSVDPMADKYPNISPYAYCAWNPVKLVDPDGEGPKDRILIAQGMLGIPYKQESNTKPYFLRTGSNDMAMQYMDCSEFVCRVMAVDGITERVEHHNTTSLINNVFSDDSKYVKSEFPQMGDIVIWNGHTGIVKAYDQDKQKVTVIHATRYKNISSVVEEEYSMGYYNSRKAEFYHPREETPDVMDKTYKGKELETIKITAKLDE